MSFLNQPSLRALRLTARPLLWLWLASGALAVGSAGATEPETPARVRDLAYGTVLYEYYQGNAFEALSRLSVADARGGIIGHGANPELVEGGLMLAYGMTREARALFESMLDGQVTSSRRNQAWFYLGKVLYLEDDKAGANGALAHVEPEALAEEAPGLYPEWLYLRGQLALQTGHAAVSEWLAKMPDDNLWGAYLRYNRAIRQVTDGQRAPAIDGLTVLAEQLAETLDRQPDRNDTAERQALRDRTLLTVGQLQLEAGDYTQARSVLAKIRLDSVFSDEALFHFAVAAAHDRDFGLALRALDTLQRRPLFTPWLQQVPYARGFVFEQMGHQQQALDAYRSAAEHYQSLSGKLAREQASLSETRLNDALAFNRGDKAPSSDDDRKQPLTLADLAIRNDAYGRIDVQPVDFSLAALLASERFQLSLRDLHELYRLQQSMGRWQRQLASFRTMLDTRARQRARRIEETRTALAAQQAAQWQARLDRYNHEVAEATERGDAAFFMNDRQVAIHRTLERVREELAALPDDERTAAQRTQYRRIRAYFDWWVADEYPVNRWDTQKQLNELNHAIAAFKDQKSSIVREMASDDRHDALAARVQTSQQRLEQLRETLTRALSDARLALLGQVRGELDRQQQEVGGYLRASRLAQARLSDALLRAAPADEAMSSQPEARP